ncbi:hypothetical protein EJ08DRAFT_647527 [Tothia fuscella]|uniref:Uncharacterized protein n=1 Tax=Tothia fuscella TaxID=1048955 RepID=A0A9P4NXS5_9PEZI|nr:hypothetical protein EJ08DRAFT_647527 [Tothia fuscella]
MLTPFRASIVVTFVGAARSKDTCVHGLWSRNNITMLLFAIEQYGEHCVVQNEARSKQEALMTGEDQLLITLQMQHTHGVFAILE